MVETPTTFSNKEDSTRNSVRGISEKIKQERICKLWEKYYELSRRIKVPDR